jgi:hypothetical protein
LFTLKEACAELFKASVLWGHGYLAILRHTLLELESLAVVHLGRRRLGVWESCSGCANISSQPIRHSLEKQNLHINIPIVNAGIAAQYLQLNPQATAVEVRKAIMDMASPDVVTGVPFHTKLAYTNLTVVPTQLAADAGMSTATTVLIALSELQDSKMIVLRL